MGDESIGQACSSLKANRILIDLGKGQGGVVKPQESRFDGECQKLFDEAVRFQREVERTQPRLWTSALVEDLSCYAKKHGLTVRFLGPRHPSGYGREAATYHRGEITIGAVVPAPSSYKKLEFDLDHEFGHRRDDKLIGFFYPEARRLLDADQITGEEALRVADDYLKLMRERVPMGERAHFIIRARDFLFGDTKKVTPAQVSHIVRMLSELLRYGEEIYDERLRKVFLGPEIPLHFRRDSRATAADYQRLEEKRRARDWSYFERVILVAEMQEAGLWDEFQKRADFDPKIAATVDEKHIQFARACIRAATRFYPIVGLPR